MTQTLPLDLEPRLKVVQQTWCGPDWWAAKCLDCNTWATKYDCSPEDARESAASHRC